MSETLESLRRIQARSSQEIEQYEARRAAAKTARELLTQSQAWEASGCPELHRTRLIDPRGRNPDWDAAYEWARKHIANGGVIALIGDRGTGKTQIGVELIRRACLSLYPPEPSLYVRAADLYSALRDDMRSKEACEGRSIARWVKPKNLIIDEAHERNANSDFEPRVMNNILDKRYGEIHGTAFIANVNGDTDKEQAQAFRNLVGETIFDRLSETGGIYCCNWKSFRVKGGK